MPSKTTKTAISLLLCIGILSPDAMYFATPPRHALPHATLALPAGWETENSRLCFLGRKPRPTPAKTAERALMDYSAAAKGLFDNMRGPASFLAGSMVPLGFFAAPKVSEGDSPTMKRVKRLHFVIATITIACELLTVMWSTVAVNKLTEAAALPAESVMQLLSRDYELEWIGCNVNFMIGLLGFASCLVTFAFTSFGPAKHFVSLFMSASFCLMMSIINDGVAKGDGGDFSFAGNFAGLLMRYVQLLITRIWKSPGICSVASVALFTASVTCAVKMLLRQPQKEDER